MEKVKKFIELLITQTEDAKKQYENIDDYIDGKLDALKIVKEYVDRKIEIDNL